jgi:putative transposase
MCRVLEVSESGYYGYRTRTESEREIENQRLTEKILHIHKVSRSNYGSRRVYQELRKQGEVVNHKRIERLMKVEGICAKRARKFKATTDSRHDLPVAQNLLRREFTVDAPDKVWVGDITYIWTEEGWLYLSVFIDLYSRMVVGWSMSSRMTSQLVTDALMMGYYRRTGRITPLVHSDRGSQYASADFTDKLRILGFGQSMSRKGNCWDNAVSESFFSSLKLELVHHERFQTRREAQAAIFDYIEVFFNRQRLHSSNGYLSPVEFEELHQPAA